MIVLNSDNKSLEYKIGRFLNNNGLTLSLAESCTGGMLSAKITDVPGSSNYFKGGVISYHDRVKYKVLGVSDNALAVHGAVSSEVARAMATGVQELLDTNIAVSITGIAGPDGGTAEKPVGLVFMAIIGPWGEQVEKMYFSGNRSMVRESTVAAALSMLFEYMLNEPRT